MVNWLLRLSGEQDYSELVDWLIGGCDLRFYLRVLKKYAEIKRFYLTGKWLIWYKK